MTWSITKETPVTPEVLNLIAHLPTSSLPRLVEADFFRNLKDEDFMRIAYLLAKKGLEEGGCPIGGMIIDNETRKIVGKGHNTLVQDNNPYNHGETAALEDAGRKDFSLTTMFTTLTPCDICTAVVLHRGFPHLVIGDVTNTGPGNIEQFREAGIKVEVLELPEIVDQYAKYAEENPDLHMEDWKGKAGLHAHSHGHDEPHAP